MPVDSHDSQPGDSGAADPLQRYQLDKDLPVYLVGCFDKGITVFSQQVRALNLAWILTDPNRTDSNAQTLVGGPSADASKRVAIIGGGFVGLTIAAALLKKRVAAKITLFERRDTLLPLQHGCDSRWLHPHIYDWPKPGSEAYSAALPVLNWTAGRASDVVVQVMDAWREVLTIVAPEAETEKAQAGAGGAGTAGAGKRSPSVGIKNEPQLKDLIRIYCNTQYLHASKSDTRGLVKVEWVGNPRNPREPTMPLPESLDATGMNDDFSHVILATGFGLERDIDWQRSSYWRNETFGQPNLEQARLTYIVSGAGDGALIDLSRLRIADYRQDRILSELFHDQGLLTERLRIVADRPNKETYNQLSSLWSEANPDQDIKTACRDVLERLHHRLRNDTTVILRLRPQDYEYENFTGIFDQENSSFQNRLLAFLLYKCGAFYASTREICSLAAEHSVEDDRIIRRHGTDKIDVVKSVLNKKLHERLVAMGEIAKDNPAEYSGTPEILWSGGYFDEPLSPQETDIERFKTSWRKEYLPSPFEMIATTLCSAVAGYLSSAYSPSARLRVTLHRRLVIGNETVLQQCCDYQIVGSEETETTPVGTKAIRTAGRTFPANNGTIGVAYHYRKCVRTGRNIKWKDLDEDMKSLDLMETSRKLAKKVWSIAALPFLTTHAQSSEILGVLYMDSYQKNFFATDETQMSTVSKICQSFLSTLNEVSGTNAGRLANTEFWGRGTETAVPDPRALKDSWLALEVMEDLAVPTTSNAKQLNIDFSDFRPVE